MERSYTAAVRDGFFDLIEHDIVDIWNDLDRSVDMIKSGNWKKHYSEVVAKYRFSSRFAIMRILFEKETGLPPFKITQQALVKGFSVADLGNFPDITVKHAKQMTDAEVALYQQLLLRRVEKHNPDFLPEASALASAILESSSIGTKCKLNRDELLRFGHMVDFSLEDMQFILLRVLSDNEAGFRYSSSMDLIDIFGFLAHASLAQVNKLKTWYVQNTATIKKVAYAEKPVQFTQNIATSFQQVFSHWSPKNRVAKFKDWLMQNAPYLDLKSKTARRAYINLAAYVYDLSNNALNKMRDISGESIYDDVKKLCELPDYHTYAQQLFFKGSAPDSKKCSAVAKVLIYENAEYAGGFNIHKGTGSALFYHVPHIENKQITVCGKLNKNSTIRVKNILTDKITPTKSDLLYLLWLAANCHWIGKMNAEKEKTAFMDEFLAAAACILEEALLPEFYPPNILEETLMLALVLGDEHNTPAMVYESICCVFTQKGVTKRPAGTKNKTPEEKKKILEYFDSLLPKYPKIGDREKICAEKFSISVKSVQKYRQDRKEGKL